MDLKALSAIMADTLAAHVPSARRRDDGAVDLGFGGLRAECEVTRLHSPRIAELHLWLTGGALEPAWVEDTWAGFGDSATEAVVHGVHDWVAGSLVAVRDAFGGEAPGRACELDGAARALFASPLSLRGEVARYDALVAAAGEGLARRLMAADALPWLPPERPHFIGCFASRAGDAPTYEVKLNGVGWPAAHAALGAMPWPPGDGYLSVRELAVLGAAAAPRALPLPALLRRTLAGLAQCERAAQVHGARAHRFALEPPLAEHAVAALERDAGVALPPDYRAFVTTAARAGAGPGYGLLPPDTAAQRELMRGRFAAGEGAVNASGVVALAHHGCGYMSVLVVDPGAHHGEVWSDLSASRRGLVRAHASFTEWYRAWLGALVSAYPPPGVGEAEPCTLHDALASHLAAAERRLGRALGTADADSAVRGFGASRVATAAIGGAYFAPGTPLDLCAGCYALARRLGMRDEQLLAGEPPRQAR